MPSVILAAAILAAPPTPQVWYGYGGNAQHTAQSQVKTQPLDKIIWKTPVDLNPPYSGDDLLVHYGEPSITAANTVVVPVKTGLNDGFKVEGRRGSDGRLIWQSMSKYTLPPHGWVPSYGLTLLPNGGVAFPNSGGRITVRASADAASSTLTNLCFFGTDNYNAARATYDANIKICTPLTAGPDGAVYFGYIALGDTPLHLKSGLAKVNPDGTATYQSATAISGDAGLTQIKQNCAPAISNGGTIVFITVYSGPYGRGKLVGVRTTNLARKFAVDLMDPKSGQYATIDADGTAAPLMAPDGDVFYGVLENGFGSNGYRGWLLHFSGDLKLQKTPAAFGWDNTPTIVPSKIVPFYRGTSPYLLFTKYNNYAGGGGEGLNRIALLDPNDSAIESRSGILAMKEIATQLGPTPDTDFLPDHPNAVREWCINSGAVDIPGKAIIANCEDGVLYKWDLTTNTLAQSIRLTAGIGEAYTPTLIGPDGKCYGINNATLFAIGTTTP